MPSTAVQRLESLLRGRKLDRTLTSVLPAQAYRVLPTRLESLDRILPGGWPAGEVSEIVGRPSSGRTSVLMASMAAATAQGGLVGLVDACDRLDPRAASQAGVDLDRVLWVRGPVMTAERHLGSRQRGLLDRAVVQALRAFDLFIRAGGFALAALDIGDVPAARLRARPYTTWMRLAHANEGRDTVALILADGPVGKSAHGASLRLTAEAQWTGDSRQARRFNGFRIRPSVVSSARLARTADASEVDVLLSRA